jgi:hypothetical protein
MIQKLDLLPSSSEGRRSILLDPLGKTSITGELEVEVEVEVKL